MSSHVSPAQEPEQNNEGERSNERRCEKAIENWRVMLNPGQCSETVYGDCGCGESPVVRNYQSFR